MHVCILANMNDHPWKGIILNRFISAKNNTYEKEYYPPYNALLYTHFPPSENYIVAPVTHPLGNTESIDLAVEYVIEMDNHPVFLLEVKSASSLDNKSSRTDADLQMRKRLGDMIESCPLDVLHGVIAFGTKIAFYSANRRTQTIDPPEIPRSTTWVIDTAPIERWENNDVLRSEGALRLEALFASIKNECLKL